MSNDVQSLGDPFELFSQYSPMGRNYGNPVMNTLMQVAFGSNYTPEPQGGQDIHDSFLLRERSKQFMQLQRSSFSNNMLFKKMGLSGNPLSQMIGGMAGSPDSSIGRVMQPLLGGNPMAASMKLFSNMAGSDTMGAFGRTGPISAGETEDTMQALANNFYKSQSYEGPEGYREESRKKMRERINTLATTEGGRKKLKGMGLEINVDESGKMDEASKKKVESFDITAGKSAAEVEEEVKNTRSGTLRTNVSKILGESDKKIQSTLYSRFEEQMKAFGAATAKELEQAKGPDGRPDAVKVRSLLDRYQRQGGDLASPQAKEARESIAKDLTSDMERMVKAPAIDKKVASDAIANKLIDTGLATPAQVERMRKYDRSIRPNEALKLLRDNEEMSRKATEKVVKTVPVDLERLNKAEYAGTTTKSRSDLRKQLSTKIADFSYKNLNNEDVAKQVDDSGAEEVIKRIKKQNAGVEKEILGDAANLGPRPIIDFLTRRNQPGKKELSSSLEKKLLAEKIVTQDELKGIKKDGVIEYTDSLRLNKQLQDRQKERVSTLREDLAHFEDAGEAGAAARKRLENNMKDFGVATPEEIQQRRVLGSKEKRSFWDRARYGGDPYKPGKAFSKEEAEKLVDRYEERESTFSNNIDRDIHTLQFAPKSGSKKDISEGLEKKMLHYGVATQEEIKKIKDRDGLLSEEGVKNLVAKNKKIKKATEDSFKEDLENIKKAPVAGQSKEEISKTIEDRLVKNKLATAEELDSLRETPRSNQKFDELLKKNPELKKTYEATKTETREDQDTTEAQDARAKAQKKLDSLLETDPQLKKAYEATKPPQAPLDTQKVKKFLSKAEDRRKAKVKDLEKQITEVAKTPVGQDKEALNEALEKKLVDTGVVTKESLPTLRDDQGKLDQKKVQEVVKGWTASGAASSGYETEDARAIRNRINDKKLVASNMSTELENISKEKDDDVRKALEEKFKEQLKEYGVAAESVIDKKTGRVDLNKSKDLVQDLGTLDEFEQEYKKTKDAKEGGGRFKGYKFENSRGFKLEDFSEAFSKGAELRMLGETRGRGIADTMGDFSKNAGGAMSAARSVFGDKPTGELMSNMSSLVGTSEVNLTTVEGSEKMEMLLRKVKATARTAGMSIKALLGIIDSTKELFSQNPELQYTNTNTTTKIAVDAVHNASKMASTMSAADYREAGGARALASEEVQGKAAYMESGFGQTTAGLLALAKSSGDDKKYKELLGLVKEGKITPEYLQGKEGWRKMQELTGMTGSDISLALSNPEIARSGLKQAEIGEAVADSYQTVTSKTMFDALERRDGGVDANGRNIKGKNKQEWAEKFKESGLTFEQFLPQMMKNFSGEEAKVFTTHKGTIREDLITAGLSTEEKEKATKRRDAEMERDKELDKEYAGIRSPLAAQFIDKMAKGEKINMDSAIDAMTGLFATTDKQSAGTQAVMKKAQEAGARLGSLASRKKLTDEEKVEAVAGINDVLAARKEQALAKGDNALAGKIGNVTEGEMVEASEVMKAFTFDDAKVQLADLRKQKAEGKTLSAASAKRLKGLETAEKATLLESESAYNTAKKGGPAAFAAGVMQSSVDTQVADYLAKKEEGRVDDASVKLKRDADRDDQRAKTNAKKEAKEAALKEGKSETEAEAIGDEAAKNAGPSLTRQVLDSTGGDVSLLLKQRSKNQGIFADEEVRKKFDKSDAGALLNDTQSDIDTDRAEIKTKADAEAAESPYVKKAEELKTSIDNLNNTVSTGGPIGEALRMLTQSLTTGTALEKTTVGSAGSW